MTTVSMSFETAQEILKEYIQEDGSLYSLGCYLSVCEKMLVIDTQYLTPVELVAIGVYCIHKGWH